MPNNTDLPLKAYAHIIDGVVVNVSVWDGVQEYTPPGGAVMVELPSTVDEDGTVRYYGGIGWDYDGENFVDNRPVEEPF